MPERADVPRRLRVEHLRTPLGLGERTPRLSWWLPEGSARQEAYRIVGDNGWDTGRVDSPRTVLVAYDGPLLGSSQRVEFRVKVWTDLGESDWSRESWFELGLLSAADWSAVWISPDEREVAPPGSRPAWDLRSDCDVGVVPAAARLYATAHGIYEAFLNGFRVGDVELAPGYTEYRSRLQVQAYDVTNLVAAGTNVLEFRLSDGWFRGQNGAPRAHDQWGTELAVLAELRGDGIPLLVTGPGWRSRRSGVTRADLIAGQTTDLLARDSSWSGVRLTDADLSTLTTSPAPPVRRVEQLTPVAVRRVTCGQLFDLGQNINGWVRLERLGPEGAEITLSHGEALDADGDLTTEHLDVRLPFLPAPLPAGQIDRVISAGRPGEHFEPRHTTHGFRYVRVEGHPEALSETDLTGLVVHTDMDRTGWFSCSDERINRLHEAAVWSLRGNTCDIPTDNPTRERAGWTGDWQIFVPTAAFLYDVTGLTRKWLRDLAAEQWDTGLVANLAPSPPMESRAGALAGMNGSAGWGDAAVIVPWEIYRASGDARVLEEQWPSMVRWLDHVERSAAGDRHPDRAERHPVPRQHDRYLWDTGFHWGEWLVPGADLKGPEEFEAFRVADKSDVATAYFAYSSELMSRVAAAIGRSADAERYAALSDSVRAAWRAEFISSDGAVSPDTQANLVRALAFGLIPSGLRERTAERLAGLIRANDTHLATGFLATPQLLPVLADAGKAALAYELLFVDSIPSWLYMIDRGATTVWERWDGIRADGTPYESLNHYSKGAVVSFLHRYTAGIQLLDEHPGYRRFRIAPRPGGGITWASARHDCPFGEIESSWRLTDDRFELTVRVPPGTIAEVVLPDGVRSCGPGSTTLTAPGGSAQ